MSVEARPLRVHVSQKSDGKYAGRKAIQYSSDWSQLSSRCHQTIFGPCNACDCAHRPRWRRI